MSANWEYAKASSEISNLGGLEAFKKFHFNRGVISSTKVWMPATIVVGITASVLTSIYQKQKSAKEQNVLIKDKVLEFEKNCEDASQDPEYEIVEID